MFQLMFFQNILRTFYDKKFYKEAEGDSFGKRTLMLYVVCLAFSFVAIFGIYNFYVQYRDKVGQFATNLKQSLPSLYPQDLEVRIANGELSINQPEPYYLGNEILTATIGQTESDRPLPNFITIDTKAVIDDYDSHNTLILVNKKGVIMKQSERGEIRYYPFSQFTPENNKNNELTFDYKKYMQGVKEFGPIVENIPQLFAYGIVAIGVFVILVYPLLVLVGWYIALLFLSVLGLLVTMIIRRKQTYGYVYKMSMYIAIPLTVLQNVHVIAGSLGVVGTPDFSGYTWLVYLLLLAIFVPEVSKPKQVSDQQGVLDPPTQNQIVDSSQQSVDRK